MGQKANRGRLASKSTGSRKGPGLKKFADASKVKGRMKGQDLGTPGGPIPIPPSKGGGQR